MNEALNKYLGLFVSEASDHLAKIGAELVRLEAARDRGEITPIVDELFRHVHSVKGMAGSLELDGIAAVAHRAEDLVGALRGNAAPDAASIDELLAAVDGLTAMIERARSGESPHPDPGLMARLDAATRSAGEHRPPQGHVQRPALPADPRGATSAPDAARTRSVAVEVELEPTCPVPAVRGFLVVKRLERFGPISRSEPSLQDLRTGNLPAGRLLVQLETQEGLTEVERALSQISDLQRVEVREVGRGADEPGREPARHEPAGADTSPPPRPPSKQPAGPSPDAQGARTVRVRVDLLDAFLDAVGELILATARLREVGRGVPEPYRPALDDGIDRLHGTVKDLHDQVMAVRMTPLSVATERLPRAARDLARRTGKQVEVEVQGADIEIDRAILDDLTEPLLHVLRNAVDHGIETPEARRQAGKPPAGRITFTARRDRGRVVLEIVDDGRGMDVARLRAAAVAAGALTEDAARALPDREAFLLACLPGISTAEELTEVSGRGVGMDAVRRAVVALGGTIDVESAPSRGTRWILRLPLTVAVQPLLLVGVGGEVLGLPVAKVYGAAQVDPVRLDGHGAAELVVEDRPVPVKDLRALLGFDTSGSRPLTSVVVAEVDAGRVGLAVDALLGQQDAVLKPLVRPFDRIPGLSAVTVLPSGRPVFVLDVQRLLAA